LVGQGLEGILRDHFQILVIDGFADGIGRGVDGDLKLLLPQLCLAAFDFVVDFVGLVVQLKSLLPEIQQENPDRQAAEDAEEEFQHRDEGGRMKAETNR
jgi:hypothetical protein